MPDFESALLDYKSLSKALVLAIFFFFGWDVIFNLAEETKDAAKTSRKAGVVAFTILVVIFVFFTHVAAQNLTADKIEKSAGNVLFALVDSALPKPFGYAAVVIFLLSALGAIETSIIQYSRTLFSQGRDEEIRLSFSKRVLTDRAPILAIAAGSAVALLLMGASYAAQGVKEAINSAIASTGVFVAYFYGMTGFACAVHFRKSQMVGVRSRLLYVLWPAFSGLCLFVAACVSAIQFDTFTGITVAIGIASGVLLFRWRCVGHRVA